MPPRWLSAPAALAATTVLVFAYWWFDHQHSLRHAFDRVAAGMSESDVLAVMGTPTDRRSQRWPPQVSEYAAVWRVQDGNFVRREYRGLDVHTHDHLISNRYSVWMDDGVFLVEYDEARRVIGKIRLAE